MSFHNRLRSLVSFPSNQTAHTSDLLFSYPGIWGNEHGL